MAQKKLAEKIINSKFKIITSSPTEIINTTAELISKGKLLGQFLITLKQDQGRLEIDL